MRYQHPFERKIVHFIRDFEEYCVVYQATKMMRLNETFMMPIDNVKYSTVNFYKILKNI